MSTARLTDLIYGHVGEPVYDTENRKWHFSRVPSITRQIKPLGQPSVILQPSIDHNSSENLQSAVNRAQNIRKLTRSYPELVPGISLLPRLAHVSEIVNEVTLHHDPTISTLLAFGKAKTERLKYLKNRGKLPEVPIVAVVGGSAGEAVRLFLLEKERLGWGKNEDIALKNFRPSTTEHCWWVGNGSPVRQLCFAEAKGDSTPWLAVRYHGAITFLQPFLRSNMVPARPFYGSCSTRAKLPLSKLDPNPVIALSIEQTGGSSHADVTFNTWDPMQFAIVDQQGCWSVWNLKSPTRVSRIWTVNAGPKGKISKDVVDGANIADTDSDGWGVISWVGDERTIIVAKRKLLSVFEIEEPPKRLIAPDLNLAKSSDWILDVKKSPLNDTHFFVATSTRVFWLRIAAFDNSQAKENFGSRMTILLSWRHFRDERDISLKMNVLNDENTTMVILYSSLTNFSTIFTFGVSQSLVGFPQSLSDPYILPIDPKSFNGHASVEPNDLCGKSRSILNLHLQLIDYESRAGPTLSGLGSSYRKDGVKIFQLSTLHKDMSLRQCLYVGLSAIDPIHVQTPKLQQRVNAPKSLVMVVKDDFIVSDRFPIEDCEDRKPVLPFQSVDSKEVEIEPSPPEEDPFTLDFEWLEKTLRRISQGSSESQSGQSFPGAPFEQCLDLIRSGILDKLAIRSPGIESMLEMLDLKIAVHDVDIASSSLHDFLVSMNDISVSHEGNDGAMTDVHAQVSGLLTGRVYNDHQPHTGITKNSLLSQVYNNLMAGWISPLPEAIPSRVRVAMEKNVRKIAAEICLASLGIRLSSESNQNEEADQQPIPEHDGELNLPLRRKSSFQKRSIRPEDRVSKRSSSPLASSQVSEDVGLMPAAEQAAQTPPTSEMSPSLRSYSSISSLKESEDPACHRLRTLASLNFQPSLPNSASNILRQWSVGADPAAFDWEATQQATDAENQSDNDENIPKAKKRRRDEKLPRRGRDNIIASSSQAAVMSAGSSQQPPVLDIRSGGSTGLHMQSSSQFTEKAIRSSQTELGRLSGRSLKFKKGKKKPGF